MNSFIYQNNFYIFIIVLIRKIKVLYDKMSRHTLTTKLLNLFHVESTVIKFIEEQLTLVSTQYIS